MPSFCGLCFVVLLLDFCNTIWHLGDWDFAGVVHHFTFSSFQTHFFLQLDHNAPLPIYWYACPHWYSTILQRRQSTMTPPPHHQMSIKAPELNPFLVQLVLFLLPLWSSVVCHLFFSILSSTLQISRINGIRTIELCPLASFPQHNLHPSNYLLQLHNNF